MIKVSDKVKKQRKRKDLLLNGITYFSSAIGVFVLVSIFVFVFSKGSGTLGLKLLTGDYWAKNYLLSVESSYNQIGNFKVPDNLDSSVYYSTRWGVGFIDATDQNQEPVVLIETIAPNSPLMHLIDESVVSKDAKKAEIGYQVENLGYKDKNGVVKMAGNIMAQNAQEVASILDNDAQTLTNMYFKTPGGGIRGSIISTLYLIVVSLLIALPLGIAAAIYLHEYAGKGKATQNSLSKNLWRMEDRDPFRL